MNGAKQFTGEIKEAAGEVAKDVKDTVGEMIEQGVQSVTGTTLTPQQIQQKQIDDQKQIADARRKLAFYQQTAQAQKQVSEENKQKEMQRMQTEQQQKQVVEIKKEEKKKEPVNPEIAYAGKAEFKRGVGG